MNARTILILLALLFFVSATMTTSHAATTFGGSRIVAIDEGQKTITFKTREGQTWTLPVADSKLLEQKVAKDDQVTIEIDLNDRIIDVHKLSDVPAAPRDTGGQSEDR
jgi:P pilus assembly chaperone PapD